MQIKIKQNFNGHSGSFIVMHYVLDNFIERERPGFITKEMVNDLTSDI